MDIQEILKQYLAATTKAKRRKLEDHYLELIVNKEIDLATRWNIYLNAPHEFKNHEYCTCDFIVLDKKVRGFSWYDNMYLEKNQTITGERIIERIEQLMRNYENDQEYLAPGSNKETIGKQFSNNPQLLDELKEEILEQNLGSFVYDW